MKMTTDQKKKIKEQITKAKIDGFDAMSKIGALQEMLAEEQKKLTEARGTVNQLQAKLK